MTQPVPVPEEVSLDALAIWLNEHLPHPNNDYNLRWKIANLRNGNGWVILFDAPTDASYFLLKWKSAQT